MPGVGWAFPLAAGFKGRLGALGHVDDEALTPVLGVLLLIAIAVGLALGVYLMVQAFQDEQDTETVRPAGRSDEQADSWELIKGTGPNIRMSDIYWKGDPGVRYAVDQPATSASPLVPTDWTALGADVPWEAGYRLHFCGDAGPVGDWSFYLQERHRQASYLGSVRFGLIAPCP